jgi:CRISPR system Cascade subunit CasA
MTALNLIANAWIPVVRRSGQCERIAPCGLTLGLSDDPIVALDWPRADLALAQRELLIGLLFAACPPRSSRDWLDWYRHPPASHVVGEALNRLLPAFHLDADGPRFLQDIDELAGSPVPVEAIFIDTPGANALKNNTDVMVKRRRFQALSRPSAAIALYALQAFAPSGGAGHRTSMRGGGPLTTLVVPPPLSNGAPAPLWHQLWANVPAGDPISVGDLPLAFPWLAATKTSDKGQTVSADDAHPAQAFFGMPRRIRLDFASGPDAFACDLTGETDSIGVTSFQTRPWGASYGVWDHPLTPYYRPKKGGTERLPVHPKEGRATFRQWVGFAFDDTERREVAKCLSVFRRERWINLETTAQPRILAAGYAMDNMKVLDFTESEWPLLPESVEGTADTLVRSAEIVARELAASVKQALFREGSKVDLDSGRLATVRDRFLRETEGHFFQLLGERVLLDELPPDKARSSRWLGVLRERAISIFDDEVPASSLMVGNPEPRVDARRKLTTTLAGYGKQGAALFGILNLSPPINARSAKRRPISTKEST